MRRLLVITVILTLLAWGESAHAQLLIQKSRVEETVDPGATIVNTIALHNNGSVPLSLTVYWSDFEYVPPFTGAKNFSPAGTGERSMAEWITFSPREVTIPPRGRRDINYTIRVPSGAKGSRYGVLFFESGQRGGADATGVSIVTRMGALFFIHSTVMDKSALIKDMRLEDGQLQGVFVNEGDGILFPRGIYYIMGSDGLVAARGDVARIYLPSAGEADFAIDLPHELKEGEYTLVLTFDLAQGESVVKEVDLKKIGATYELLRQRD